MGGTLGLIGGGDTKKKKPRKKRLTRLNYTEKAKNGDKKIFAVKINKTVEGKKWRTTHLQHSPDGN